MAQTQELDEIESDREADRWSDHEELGFQAVSSWRRLAVLRRCPAPSTMLVAAITFGLGYYPKSTRADGLTGTADYTLTATTALAPPSGPPPGTPSVTLSSTLTDGSSTVTLPSTSGLAVGYDVTGTGIPAGTTISQISSTGTQVTSSQSATSGGSASLVFAPTIAPPPVVALIQPAGGVVTPAASSTQGPLTILSGSHGFNSSGVYDFLASTKDSNGNPLQALGLSFFGQGLAAGGILNFSLNVANQSTPPQLVSQTPGVSITLDPAPARLALARPAPPAPASRARCPNPCLFWFGQPWLAPECCGSALCGGRVRLQPADDALVAQTNQVRLRQ